MRALVCGLILLLCACASAPPPTPAEPDPLPDPVSPSKPEAPISIQAPSKSTIPHAKNTIPRAKSGSLLGKVDRSKLREQIQHGNKPINIRQRCSFRNETGYNGSTRIEISNNEVKELATHINIPVAEGSCAFDGPGFRQITRSPSIELRHADGCTVRIWSQGRQLSVAYSNCARRCSSPETFKYVWPVLIDQASGRCD